jgi:glycerol-3-phosphate dehydrogenase
VLLRPESLGDLRAALTVPVSHSNSRFVFALPQLEGPVIAGLTDVEVSNFSPDDTHPPREEIDWVLKNLSTLLQRPLTTADMIGAYSGYRPLIDNTAMNDSHSGKGTADVSRRHFIGHRSDGVLIVTGGKLTTYRKMAADALDSIPIARQRRSTTMQIPLVGAPGAHYLSSTTTDSEDHTNILAPPSAAPPSAAPPSATARWRRRYGSEWKRLAKIAKGDPAFAGVVSNSGGITSAEVVYAISCEGALTVDDVVQRRTRVALQPELNAASRREFVEIARMVDPAVIDVPVDP